MRALAIALLLFSLAFPGDSSQEAQIRTWIAQLDDDRFAVREAATKKLIEAGKPAIDAVAIAADGVSFESTDRCFQVLTELSVSGAAATAEAAKRALDALAAAKKPALAARAKVALRTVESRCVALVQTDGVVVTYEAGQATRVNFTKATKIGDKLRLLHRLPHLRELYLETKLFGDAELAQLKGLTNIDHLDLFESGITDEGLKHLKDIPNVKSVPMGSTRVTDAGLVHLKDLTQLEYVGLRGDAVTGSGLVHLKKLTNLTGLTLKETQVTDANLVHLKPLTRLHHLYLESTPITNAGLDHLRDLRNLKIVWLAGSKVTKEGAERLKKFRPDLTIEGAGM